MAGTPWTSPGNGHAQPKAFMVISEKSVAPAEQRRTRRVITTGRAAPPDGSLKEVRAAALHCQACPLWKTGTQTVFGEGASHASAVFIGEVPGNDEDLAGRPFVGPAGKLLDAALAEVGIERAGIYLTNVVKHFKWEPRGKRRLHQKPNAAEIAACRPWLEAELKLVQPRLIVCLGATAAQALLGRAFRVTQQRGKPIRSSLAPFVLATVHPSSLLRMPDPAARRAAREQFIADLTVAARLLKDKSIAPVA